MAALPRVVLPSACPFRIHFPASLGSTGITLLRRYYGRSDFCSADFSVGKFRSTASAVSVLSDFVANGHQTMPCRQRTALTPGRSLGFIYVAFPSFCLQPLMCLVIASMFSKAHVTSFHRHSESSCGIRASPLASRLAATTRPNRVRFATDRWFTSRCFGQPSRECPYV